MRGTDEYIRGLVERWISSEANRREASIEILKAGAYSNHNTYRVLASSEAIADIRVDTDGFKVHYWINVDRPCIGCEGERGGHYAEVGDSARMLVFEEAVRRAIKYPLKDLGYEAR